MITSSANAQIKNIIQLQKKAKARKDQGVFLVEGPRMFREAPKDWIVKVYASESFLAKPEHRKMAEGAPLETVTDAVFEKISDTCSPQGILCILRQPVWTLEDLLREENPLLLLLENVQDPGNLGTMLRTGEGAGISGVILSRDTADLFNPKTIRSTMGSIYRMPFLYTEDLIETIRRLQARKIQIFAAHLRGKAYYDEKDYRTGCGFLIGNEGNGLTDAAADAASDYIRIPMKGKVESLNAAVAASVLMYEAARQRRQRDGMTRNTY